MSTNDSHHTKDVTITLPAAIAALPDLTLLEKAALAHIRQFPGCSNAGLSRLTGLSQRGVEALLARLRKRGLVQMSGKGRARRHELTFALEHHTTCGKDEVAKSHKECGQPDSSESHTSCAIGRPALPVSKSNETIGEFSERQFMLYDECFKLGLFDDAREHLEFLRAQLGLNSEISVEEKAEWFKAIISQEHRCFAFQTLKNAESNNELSENQLRAAAARVCKADPAKLSLFRQKVEAGALAYNVTNLFAFIDG